VIISNVVSFALVFLAPIYYPPTYLPREARLMVLMLPSMHAANMLDIASDVAYGIDLRLSTIYMATLAMVLTIVVAKKTKSKDLY